jgi:hypothetical protein
MAIYTDGTHMVSDDSLDELHEFSFNLGLKREWFQDHPEHPHYDLTTARMRKKALKKGAKLVSPKKIVLICKMTAKRNFCQDSSFKDIETNKNNNQDENS